MTAVYIHIPFCQRICSYCDFPKRVSKTIEIDKYLVALEKEAQMYQIKDKISSVYIGGGTPSILNIEQLNQLEKIIKTFTFSDKYEFTIECNPEHITKEKIDVYRRLGINRISLGVQSFNDRLLQLLNRGHTVDQVFRSVALLKQEGMDNINLDIMFAIPFQTIEDIHKDIEYIKELDVTHISSYSLILEEKTVFEKLLAENKISLIDNEIEAYMYEIYIEKLTELGFKHYEISNYAKPGFESKHNQVYWLNQEYYGLGMGASGYIGNMRYYNEKHVNKYIEKLNQGEFPIEQKDILSLDEKLKETFLLGLRLIEGVNIDRVNKRFSVDVLKVLKKEFDYLVDQGFITIDERIKLTQKGLFNGNSVFEQFI